MTIGIFRYFPLVFFESFEVTAMLNRNFRVCGKRIQHIVTGCVFSRKYV